MTYARSKSNKYSWKKNEFERNASKAITLRNTNKEPKHFMQRLWNEQNVTNLIPYRLPLLRVFEWALDICNPTSTFREVKNLWRTGLRKSLGITIGSPSTFVQFSRELAWMNKRFWGLYFYMYIDWRTEKKTNLVELRVLKDNIQVHPVLSRIFDAFF